MNIVKADLAQPIMLGRQGEHGATQVVFDLSGYIKKYGDGVAQLAVKRPGDPLEYAAVLTQTGDTATWDIGAEWTQNAGQGYCYLHWFVDDDHAKSDRFKTLVRESNSACDAPEPQAGYLDQVLAAGTKATKAAEGAEKSAAEVLIIAKRFDEEFAQTVEKAADTAVQASKDAGALNEQAGKHATSAAESKAIAENAAARAEAGKQGALTAAGAAGASAGEAAAANEQAKGAAGSALVSAENAAASEQAAAAHRVASEEAATRAEQTVRQGNTVYSNVLKGTASGEAIRINDVSPLEHTVPVRVRSKNLLDLSKVVPYYQENVTVDGDTVKIAAGTQGYGISVDGGALEVGKTYTFSFASLTGFDLSERKDWGFELRFADGTTSTLSGYTANPNPYTATINKEVIAVRFRIGYGATIQQDIEIVGLQITESAEAGVVTITVADADGAQTATYTVSEDGTCEVTAVAPVMTMTTNSPNVVMECEYNRDINKTLTEFEGTMTEFKETVDDLGFVTPEMFGAVGNGVTDDAAAIQSAINTGKKCVLQNKYVIKSTLYIPSDAVFTVNGELIVSCAVGISLNGSNTVIDGNGKITTDATTKDVICIRRYINGDYVKNVTISVNRIASGRHYSNTAIEITGGPDAGGGCYDKITSTIIAFQYGVVSRASETQNEESWYTALTIDSTIEGCRQAIVIDWGGSGFLIHGQIQPVLTDSGFPFDENLPLVKLPKGAFMDAFQWDMGTAINKYAIEVPFPNCTILTHLDKRFIKTGVNSYPLHITYPRRFAIGLASSTSTVAEHFDNTNDILLNADKNTAINTKLPSIPNINKLLAGAGDTLYITEGNGGVHTFEFEFATKKAIRCIALLGEKLPEEVSFDVSLDGTEYINLSALKLDEDYKNSPGNDAGVWWSYDYDRDKTTLGDFYEKPIQKLRVNVTFAADKSYRLTRLCAFTFAADIMKRSGGEFEGDVSFASGAGVVLTDTNGVNYRLTVGTDGTLSATAI